MRKEREGERENERERGKNKRDVSTNSEARRNKDCVTRKFPS